MVQEASDRGVDWDGIHWQRVMLHGCGGGWFQIHHKNINLGLERWVNGSNGLSVGSYLWIIFISPLLTIISIFVCSFILFLIKIIFIVSQLSICYNALLKSLFRNERHAHLFLIYCRYTGVILQGSVKNCPHLIPGSVPWAPHLATDLQLNSLTKL